ncbi:hypothetical protein ACXR0O_04770 [Verrucomicrobiota bacterium sgz303538]
MKLGIIGCLTGSAAALLFGGCAADRYAVADGCCGTYAQTAYVEEQPEYVEERTVFLDRQPHNVPVYRTGDTYFFTYAGRSYAMADYPPAPVTHTSYRTVRYSRYQRH